jgi:outer membrane protein assembly factor BamD
MYEGFIQLYPASEQTPYAYYMIALSYYEQITDTLRDQGITQRAQEALQDVVRRYPDSDYAKDARLKLDLVYDHLAGKEMSIGRYYLKKEEWLPAINRFRYVVDNYQTTTHVPEALHRMVEAYLAMGMRTDARRTAAVLGYNYPGSPWYIDSYRLLVGDPGADVVMPEDTPWWDSVKSAVGL